ncbi:MAG: Hsp20/alpha crystallin family protein [Syntrophobacterales bacterium]|nr:Hsp20/alpha crystallin family protein [Syntrophobacterales bacterium]
MAREKTQARMPVEAERTKEKRVFVPRVDIFETKDGIVIAADMPGVDDKSIDVTLEQNILTIKGRVEAKPVEGHSLAYAEYDEGDYERLFTLTDEVDREKIEAKVKNGVLEVILPKAEPAKAKKIAIKAE